MSLVQGLLSSQEFGPDAHDPPPHVSPHRARVLPLQELVLSSACTRASDRTHRPYSRCIVTVERPAPGWQVPPPHLSPTVQAFPSEQVFVLFV
jgi:hypothetical protein